jgi:Putative lumazine-binding
MKTLHVLSISSTLVALATSAALAAPNPKADETAIRQVIQAFAEAENAQSVAELEPLLLAEFRMLAKLPNGTLLPVDRESYLKGIAAKQFGGKKVGVKVAHVSLHQDTAAATVELDGAVEYHHFANFVRTAEGWKFAGSLVTLVPAAP